MRIAFNPSTVAALTTPPNNKDITFDLRGRNIFARGVKFQGTDTNTWRPVVDSLTSDSTTSSLSAKQGKILAGLINNKSDSGHNHDDRYIKKVGGIPTSAYDLIITPTNLSGDGYVDVGGGIHVKAHTGTPFQLWLHDTSNVWYKKTRDGAWKKMDAGYADIAGSVAWANVTGKPSSYTPSAHTHAWNSLTHSSTTANQAILTNGSVNGWKLYTLNISAWDNAANNAHSHSNKAILDGITSALVSSWNTAYNFVDKITKADTDKVINKWDEIVNFLAGIDSNNKLNTLLNSKLSIQQLAANDILTTKTNNALFWVNTVGTAGNIPTGPFTDHPYVLLSVTNYSQNDTNSKFFYRSRLAFSSIGDIKVASCHHQNEYKQDETWYNVLTSKNSGISGSTIKLNGTSITVYSSGTADNRYVKKSGDTMTGILTVDYANFGALIIKRSDDSNGASIQFRGKSNIYGHIGFNATSRNKQLLRWNDAGSQVYTILDTSSTYISSGKGVINGTTITQVDNSDKLDGYHANTSQAPFGLIPTVGTDGVMEIGKYIDFHNDNGGKYDYSTRLQTTGNYQNAISLPSGTGTLALTSQIPTSLKNPMTLTTFGVVYDGSAAKVVSPSNFINQLGEGASVVTDGTMLITSYASNSGFADTNAVNIPYKRKAVHLWEYIKTKTDSLYTVIGHTHDDRYLRLIGGTMTGTINRRSGGSTINGRDHAIIRQTYAPGGSSWNPIACVDTETGTWTLGHLSQGSSNTDFSFCFSTNADYNAGNNNGNYVLLRNKAGIIALTSEIPNKNSWNYDDRYYTKAESNAKYITDISTSVNKLTFTKNGSNIDRTITVNNVQSLGRRSPLTERNAISGIYTYGTYSKENNLAPTNYFETLGFGEGTAGAIEIGGSWISGGQLYWRALRDVSDNWFSWKTILDSSNYSGILDSRYYTESEVNSLLAKKLDRVNLTTGSWNPRGYSLAADYNYSGGDISLSVNGGQMHVSVDGKFWQNEGQYRVLDTSDIAGIRGSVTLYQYLSSTDNNWFPLVWGGSDHKNTNNSTGSLYKSHDKLSWQTSSQTLYATKLRTTNLDTQTAFFHPGNDSTLKIYSGRTQDGVSDGHIGLQTSIDNTDGQTHAYPTQHGSRCVLALQPRGGSVYIGNMPNGGNGRKLNVNGDIGLFNTGSIRDLAIGGGIYWNPYVESAGDGSDAASITLVKSGVAGGTTLVLSQMNDSNDTIQFQTNGSARLYHNSNQILTSGDTKVSSGKGYINNTEITQVNNSDTLDGEHATAFTRIEGRHSIGTSGTAPYNYIHLFRIANSSGYSTIDCEIDFRTRYHSAKLEIRISTAQHPYNSDGTSISIVKKIIGGRSCKFWVLSTVQSSGYNYYDIYYESGAWNSGSYGVIFKGSNGNLVFEHKGTNLDVLPSNVSVVNNQWIVWDNIAGKPSTFNPAAHTHTVFKNNLMIKGTNGISDIASIHLGIGDSDTGFKWISDGKCQIYANNVAIGQWTSEGMNWFRNPTVNGNKVWNAGNDGSGSGLDADLLDGYHENSFLRHRGTTNKDQEVTLWSQIGIKEYQKALPDSLTGVYNFGSVISLPGLYSRFEIYASHQSSKGNGLYYRSGWVNDKQPWRKFIDSSNIGSQSVNYANSAGSASSADKTRALKYTGTGSSEITAHQTDASYMGRSGWASYIICNHGNGSTYYSQTIAMPFWSSPIYRRLEGGTDRGWKKFYTEEAPPSWDNVTNKPSTFTPASHTHTWTSITDKIVAGNEFNIVNAGFKEGMWFNYLPINNRDSTATIQGYHFGNGAKGYTSVIASSFVKSGGNENQLLRADGGVATFAWSGQSGQPTWLWGGNSRHSYYVYNPSNFRVAYAASAGNADTVDGKHASDFASSSHNHDGRYAISENYGGFTRTGRLPISGFYQSYESTSGGNAPWVSWMHLINCQHSNTDNNYALQIAASFYDNNTFKIRVTNNNVNNAWRDIIHSGNIGSQTVANAYHLRINSANSWSTWNWSGQGGQPTWLWGSNDGTNMYVWNPRNFSVNYANSAGSATKVIVNQHTANDINYPLVWSNQSNTNSATENQLFKSWADLYYNPKNKRLCVAGSAIIGASAVPSYTLDVRGNIIADTWLRTRGEGGWYSESYGGGIWMFDASWIRTYGGKNFYCDHQIYSSNSIRMGDIYLQNTNEINNGANGLLHLNYRNTGNVTICNGGGKVGIGKSDPLYTLDVAGNGRFQDFVYCNAVYSTALNHTSSTGHLVIGNKTKEISIRSSNLPDLNALYLYQKFSTNVYYSANKGFGIRPYYLSNAGSSVLPTETVYNNKYLVLTVGDKVQAISCIIADKTPSISGVKGTLIRFMPGDDGQIVLLKDLNNYGVGSNGYFWVQPKGCSIVRSDNSDVYIADGNISSSYDDGGARFFIYAKTHKVWIEFFCG